MGRGHYVSNSLAVTAFALLALLVVGWIVFHEVNYAAQKLFWFDEGFDALHVCKASVSQMIAKGAPAQCSPAPLFHVFQKFLLTHLVNGHLDSSLFWKYRAVSLLSSLAVLLAFLKYFSKFGFEYVFFSLAVLNSRSIFHFYAAESRAYMLWLALLASSFFWIAGRAEKPLSKESRGALLFGAILQLGLTLTATPGFVQVLMADFLLLTHQLKKKAGDLKNIRALALFLVPVTSLCLGAGIYYALKSCSDAALMSKYDLLYSKDRTLFMSALRLIWPEGGGFSSLSNFLFLLGSFESLRVKKNREEIFFAGRLFLGLVPIALIMGALVVVKHYFFVPRLFLYLVLSHAVLATVGALSAVRYVRNIFLASERTSRALRGAILVSSLAVLLTSLSTKSSLDWSAPVGLVDELFHSLRGGDCALSSGPYSIYVPRDSDPQFIPNFIGLFAKQAEACHWIIGGSIGGSSSGASKQAENQPGRSDQVIAPQKVLAQPRVAPGHWYSFTNEVPSNYVPALQCGVEVQLLR